jgi:hypothetical protein
MSEMESSSTSTRPAIPSASKFSRCAIAQEQTIQAPWAVGLAEGLLSARSLAA